MKAFLKSRLQSIGLKLIHLGSGVKPYGFVILSTLGSRYAAVGELGQFKRANYSTADTPTDALRVLADKFDGMPSA